MAEPDDADDVHMSADDRGWMVDTLLALLQTPSPSGRTDAVMQLIGQTLTKLGVPFTLTRRGALIAELPGRSQTTDRAIVVHADTIGCMVRELKDNGRLALVPVGTFSARFATGARVRSCPTTTISSSPEPSCRSRPVVMRSVMRSTLSRPVGTTSKSAWTGMWGHAPTSNGWA
ncbi:hypothetical protein MAUB1S_04705 [Mycolicibacterium aubagnense]